MRIMKCILISFIVVNLPLQGFLRSIFAANIADQPKQPKFTGFALYPQGTTMTRSGKNLASSQNLPLKYCLKVKPLTMNEQVFLKAIEAKTHSLLDRAAGTYYDEKYEKPQQLLRKDNPNSISPGLTIIGGAMIGAFFALLNSSGDTGSIKKSVWTGALYGVVTISLLYYAF